jgi:hypothetical protein
MKDYAIMDDTFNDRTEKISKFEELVKRSTLTKEEEIYLVIISN